jgi:hypothetical protein
MIEADKAQQLMQIPLYRYLSFDKFLYTLKEGLFVPKASLFSDRWEGMIHWMHGVLEDQNEAKAANEKVPDFHDWAVGEMQKEIHKQKKGIYASCWNSADHECIAMWELYGKGENAIMLETNAKELVNIFIDFDKSKEWIACLTDLAYIVPGDESYDNILNGKESIWKNDYIGRFPRARFQTFGFLHYKHVSYRFENEHRLLIAYNKIGERQGDGITLRPLKKSFIKRVILQPDSSDIFRDEVKDCLKKNKFNDVPVEKSFLDKLPPLADKSV